MKKKYFAPEIEIKAFHIADIITTSNVDDGMDTNSSADLTDGGSGGLEMNMNEAE